MRADLSTIQQTLTPEAAAALGLAMEEAARRRHGQTTPLHVVAALLAAPAGLLRTACARTAAAGHPLQCRALELCFSVALDRLPAAAAAVAQGAGAASPVSNALVAALKRAQAQQRRGCPEAAQQPLLAVKVELDQLVLSILDDPSVSRVMKEASFSSAAIKSTIEHFLTSSPSKASTITTASISSPSPASLPLATSRSGNPYLNPRLAAASSGACTGEDAKKVLDIMLKPSRRNPVLVGDAGPDAVLKEALLRIPTSGSATLAGAKVLPLEAEFVALAGDKLSITARIAKLSAAVEKLVREGGGAVLELGDLKWLLDGPAASESGKAAVAEMGRLLRRFGPGSLWAVGTATCATYLRCKVYHPLMEAEWDLHAVPIARTAPLPISLMNARPCPSPTPSPIQVLPAVAPRPLRPPESTERAAEKPVMCQLCKAGHERELAKIVAEWTDRTPGPGLPHWLQLGADKTQSKEQELKWKKSTEELEKKWRETCASIHLSVSLPLPLSAQTLSMPLRALGPSLPVEPKLLLANRMRADTLTMNRNWEWSPGRPVKTDLVLGSFREKVETDAPKEGLTDVQKGKIAGISDIESFKRLLKGLTEKVAWQSDAASAIAATVIQCRSGDGKRRSSGQKGDMWLLFIGPDQVGKWKMASALSELMANTSPVVVNIGTEGKCGPNVGFWGKTFLDRVAEAVRQNPFSVIMLNGIDQADDVMRGKIKRAMETGRLPDSRGRDVSLGNVIFVLTANWVPEELSGSANQELLQEEAKLADIASSSWQLELAVGDIRVKHRADWDSENGRPRKMTKELYTGPRLSLDLNLAVGSLNHTDGSRNSSDVTVEHEQDQQGQLAVRCSALSPVCELLDLVDDAIVFRPVDFRPVRKTVSDCILSKFKSVICSGCSFTVDEDVVNRLVGTVWFTEEKVDDWAEKVLAPSFERMSRNLKRDGGCAVVLRLALAMDNALPRRGEAWEGLPSTVTIAVDGTPTGNQCK